MRTQIVHKTLEVNDRYYMLRPGKVHDYFLDGINHALALVDIKALRVTYIALRRLDCRGMSTKRGSGNVISMDPATRSFKPDYRGYKYKKFGARADLTPGGVFLHECGHSVHRIFPGIRRKFKALRKIRGRKKSITSYATKYLDEDIAECFRLFAANPLELLMLDADRFEIMYDYCAAMCNHKDLVHFKNNDGIDVNGTQVVYTASMAV